MYRLVVVIVNFRTPDLVLQGLASLDHELDPERDCTIVVDNHSEDGSAARLREESAARSWRKWVSVVEADNNRGFSAGNNMGIHATEAKYYLLLNSDAYLRPGAVIRLLAAAEADTKRGLIAPRLEWPDGEPQISCFRAPSPFSEVISAAQTRHVTSLLRWFDIPIPLSDRSVKPEWVSFACVLVRGDVLRALGGLDEGYFMFFEDVDFCCRMRAEGWTVWYEPDARAVHLRGGTSPVKSDQASLKRLPRYWYASRARYFRKFYGRHGLWLANLCWYAGRSISKSREIIGHKRPHVCERKWRDIWIDDYQPPT